MCLALFKKNCFIEVERAADTISTKRLQKAVDVECIECDVSVSGMF